MRIFVAGATGVIGRRIIPLLLAEGHQLTAVCRTQAKRSLLEELGAEPIDVDLFSPIEVRGALVGHDTVINLATSIPSTNRLMFPGAWRKNDRLRRYASANLVDAAIQQNVRRFIQESFALAYQDLGDNWIDENSALKPSSHTLSTFDAEKAVETFTANGGTGVALRFGLFYGPDSSQTLEMMRFVRHGIAMMPGPGNRYLSSVCHDDAATAVVAALHADRGIYNVVDDEPLQKTAYFAALAEALGVGSPALLPSWTRYMLGSVGTTISRSLRISNRKFRAETGWEPAFPSAREGWPSIVEQIGENSAS